MYSEVGEESAQTTAGVHSGHSQSEGSVPEISFSDLEFGEQLGEGAFGVVYRGHWKSRDMDVAIKRVHGKINKTEIQILNQLTHPCIIRFHGVVVDGPGPPEHYIITELAEGGSLYDLLHKKNYQPTQEERLQWAAQIVQGMMYLHKEKIMHRDLKSSNVLLTGEGNIKICDFGGAKYFDQTTKQTQTGTYRWMAPEVMKGEPVSLSSDVFSYGMLLYEILTGELPFTDAKTDVMVSSQILSGEVPPIPVEMESYLAETLEQCWKTNPKDLSDAFWKKHEMAFDKYLHLSCTCQARPRFSDILEVLRTQGSRRKEEGRPAAEEIHHSLQEDSPTEEMMQGRAPTALATSAPMVPAFLQQKAKPEALPMGLTYQHPHQATQSPGPSTKNIVATKASQILEARLDALQVRADKLSTDSEMRFQKLEEEMQELRSQVTDRDQEIEKQHNQIRKLEKQLEELRVKKEEELEELRVKKDEEIEEVKVKKEEEIRDCKMKIQKLEEENQKLRSQLKDKNQEYKELHPPAFFQTVRGYIPEKNEEKLQEEAENNEEQSEDYVDVSYGAPPYSKSAPEEDLEDAIPKKWKRGKRLGKGSFGKVYICHHQDHTKLLAVKVIDTCGNKLRKLTSFTNEVSTVMQVDKHDRIVEYVDIETEQNRLYIIMEYMPGGTLREHYLERDSGMNLPDVQKYTRQLLEGVAHLHDNKIIHRDIKGANILLDSKGDIKLADFGCAKTLANIDDDGKMSHEQGTIYWRAPETVKESQGSLHYVFESDIWSVGATVIELMKGKRPYHSYEYHQVYWLLGSDEPKFKTPYDVCEIKELDQQIVTFFNYCFQREPSERWTAQKLLQEAEFCRIR